MKYLKFIILFIFCFLSFFANAENSNNELLNKISKNIRCLICQGQSVYDSHSDFAISMKLVIKKKTKDPIKAPEILDMILWIKYFDNNPMIITLPQVNKANPWKPIKKSVIAKLNSKAGKYLIPNKAGI